MKTECTSIDTVLGGTGRDPLRRFLGLQSKYTLCLSTYDAYSDKAHRGLSFALNIKS
jgi:hypothetical protein